MVVTALGNTCETCAPQAETRVERTEAGQRIANTFRVWWARCADGYGEWRVVWETLTDQGVQRTRFLQQDVAEETPEPTLESIAVNDGWKRVLTPDLEEIFGPEDWPVIVQVWQPEDCRILDAFAILLEEFWLRIVAEKDGSASMVVRLTGLPPVVAVLLPEVASRWMESEGCTGLPVAEMVALYHDLGPLLCAATGHTTECTALEQLLGDVLILPTLQALDRLPIAPVRLALTATSDLPSIADLLGPERVRERVPRHGEQHALRPRRPVPRAARRTEAGEFQHSEVRRDVAMPENPALDSAARSETEVPEGFRTTETKVPGMTGRSKLAGTDVREVTMTPDSAAAPDIANTVRTGETLPPTQRTPRPTGVHRPQDPAVPAGEGDAKQGGVHRQMGRAIDGDGSVGGGRVGAGGSIRGGPGAHAGFSDADGGTGGGGGGFFGGGGRVVVSGGILATGQALRTAGSAPSSASTFGHA